MSRSVDLGSREHVHLAIRLTLKLGQEKQNVRLILDGVSLALRNVDAIDAKDLPRLADFAAFGIAAEDGLGLQPGSVLTALNGVQEQAALNALSLDCVGQAVLEFMTEHCDTEWRGSAAQLMKTTRPELDKPGTWPKDAAIFSKQIGRLAGAFRYRGIIVERTHTRDGNLITLKKTAEFAPHKTTKDHVHDQIMEDIDDCFGE